MVNLFVKLQYYSGGVEKEENGKKSKTLGGYTYIKENA